MGNRDEKDKKSERRSTRVREEKTELITESELNKLKREPTKTSSGIPEWRHRPNADEVTEAKWVPIKRLSRTGNVVFFVFLAALIYGTFHFRSQIKSTYDHVVKQLKRIEEARERAKIPAELVTWPKTRITSVKRTANKKTSSTFTLSLDRELTEGHVNVGMLLNRGKKKNRDWLIVDVLGVTEPYKKRAINIEDKRVRKIRFGKHSEPPMMRIVFETQSRFKGSYDYSVEGKTIRVSIFDKKQQHTLVRKKTTVDPTRKEVRRLLMENTDKFQACYEDALIGDEKLSGVVYVDFKLAKSGKLKNLNFRVSKRANNKLFLACLNKQVKKLAFPKPKKAGIPYSFPLRFERSS